MDNATNNDDDDDNDNNNGDDDDDDDYYGGGSGGVIEEETVEFTIEEECVPQEQARDAALKEKTKALIENRKKNGLTVGLHNGILTPILPTYK